MGRKVARRGLIVAGALVIGLVLAEGLVRLLVPQPSGPGRRDGGPMGLRLDPDGDSAVETAEFAHQVRVNAAGYHDRDHTRPKTPGVRRVAVIGDSFVEAVQVPLRDTFCQRLDRELGGRDDAVEVLNLGVAGAGTAGEYLRLRDEVPGYEPDLVLLVFAITNDVYNNSPALESKPSKPFFRLDGGRLVRVSAVDVKEASDLGGGVLDAAAGHLHLARLLARLLASEARMTRDHGGAIPLDFFVFAPEPDPVWTDAWEVTGALLAAARDAAEGAGAAFAVVVLPDRVQVHDELWRRAVDAYPAMEDLTWDLDAPNRRLAALCDGHELVCHDLLPAFRERAAAGASLYYPIDGHLDDSGHAAMAAELAALLRARWPELVGGSGEPAAGAGEGEDAAGGEVGQAAGG